MAKHQEAAAAELLTVALTSSGLESVLSQLTDR